MSHPGPTPPYTGPHPGSQPAAQVPPAGGPPAWGTPGPQQHPGWGQPSQPVPPAGQPPYQQWGPGQPAPGPVAAPGGGRKKLWTSIGGGVAAVAIGVGVFAYQSAGEPEIGDCIQPTADGSFDVVGCDSAEAQFSIVGVQEEQQTQEDFFADPDVCSAFPTTEFAAWYGSTGDEGTVYCAGPL